MALLQRKMAGQPETRDGGDVAGFLAARIDAAALRREPFDHIYLETALPPAFYDRMLALRPDTAHYRELRKRDSIRPDGSSPRLKFELLPEFIGHLASDQRTFWADATAALDDPRVAAAFRRKFARALGERFGPTHDSVGMDPIPMLLRDTAGYRISIHSDTLRKGITVQLFMPGDARQEHLGTIFHAIGPDGRPREAVRMKFLPNSLYAFPVTATSFHSLGEMTEADGARHSLMLTYYVEQGLAGTLRRHGKRALNALKDRLRSSAGTASR